MVEKEKDGTMVTFLFDGYMLLMLRSFCGLFPPWTSRGRGGKAMAE